MAEYSVFFSACVSTEGTDIYMITNGIIPALTDLLLHARPEFCRKRRHVIMKKTESEQEIHARLRELAARARQVREDLAQSTRRRTALKELQDDRPAPGIRNRPRKKRTQ